MTERSVGTEQLQLQLPRTPEMNPGRYLDHCRFLHTTNFSRLTEVSLY